jgi:aminoglycoside phosphotransferase (APT) family kinase protein
VVEAWAPERVVDAPLARRLVESQFPDLAGQSALPFGGGFDNTAFLVGGATVFRFPRRAVAVPWLEREVRVLPRLAPSVPSPVPVPDRIGRPDPAFPWPFAGYRLLPGRVASDLALGDDARATLAEPLGRFLRALHAFPVEEARALGAGEDELRRTDVRWRAEKAEREIADAAAKGIVPDRVRRRISTVLAEMTRDAARPPAVLVHGDLYARHVLVGEAGELAGVIDWGDLHVGDRAVDVAIAFGFLPDRAREAFRQAYGAIDEGTWRLARFRAAYHATATVRYAADVGDAELVRETMRALEEI